MTSLDATPVRSSQTAPPATTVGGADCRYDITPQHRRAVFIQTIVNGLVTGCLYALIALGYTMVYGS